MPGGARLHTPLLPIAAIDKGGLGGGGRGGMLEVLLDGKASSEPGSVGRAEPSPPRISASNLHNTKHRITTITLSHPSKAPLSDG